jgi:hypothetical protein
MEAVAVAEHVAESSQRKVDVGKGLDLFAVQAQFIAVR